MDLNSDNGGESLAPKSDFRISSNYIVDKIDPSKWTLKMKGDSLTSLPFTARISETNPYQIQVQSDFVMGKVMSLPYLKKPYPLSMQKILSLSVSILMLTR